VIWRGAKQKDKNVGMLDDDRGPPSLTNDIEFVHSSIDLSVILFSLLIVYIGDSIGIS